MRDLERWSECVCVCESLVWCSGANSCVVCVCVYKIYCHCHRVLNLSYIFFSSFCSFAALKNSSVDAEISVGQRRNEAIFDRSLFRIVFDRDRARRITCETHSICGHKYWMEEREIHSFITVHSSEFYSSVFVDIVLLRYCVMRACSGKLKLSQYWQKQTESYAARI